MGGEAEAEGAGGDVAGEHEAAAVDIAKERGERGTLGKRRRGGEARGLGAERPPAEARDTKKATESPSKILYDPVLVIPRSMPSSARAQLYLAGRTAFDRARGGATASGGLAALDAEPTRHRGVSRRSTTPRSPLRRPSRTDSVRRRRAVEHGAPCVGAPPRRGSHAGRRSRRQRRPPLALATRPARPSSGRQELALSLTREVLPRRYHVCHPHPRAARPGRASTDRGVAGARAGAAEHGPEGAAPQAYGSAESDYRPERWGGFREDYRFTGKEEDVEVGLTYFGARYLSTALGRWVSADPLTVHGAGADLNGYAYVHGSVLKNVDPLGLDETDPEKADVPYDRDSEEFGYAYENEQAGSIDEVMSDKNLNVEIVRHPVADITFGADTIKIRPDAPVDVGRSIPKAAPIQESPKIDLQSSAVMRVLAIGNPALKLGVGAAEDFLNAPARAIDAGQHFARAGVLWSDATTSIDKAEALEAGLHGIKGITDAVSGLGTPFIAIGSIAKNAAKGGETAMRGCFVADTPVLTKDGYKPIAEVEAGDWVWSFDSESGAWEWNEVTQKLVHEHSGPMVVLQSGEDQILATPNHPVCLHSGAELGTRPVPLDIGEDSIRCGNSGRWVEAGQIQQGDVALGSRGQSHVDSTAVGDQSRLVYNLKVAGAHSYVVGKSQLLVHNKGAEWIPKVLQRGGNTINKGTAKALNEYADMNLHSRDWGRALEALKKDLELGNAHHGVILENGNYADSAGKVLGSILDYLPGGR